MVRLVKKIGVAIGALLVLLLVALLAQRLTFEPRILDRVQVEAIALRESRIPPDERAAVDMVGTRRGDIGPAGQCRELKTRAMDMLRPSQHYFNLCNAEAPLWVVTITSSKGIVESSMYGGNGEHIVTHDRRIEVP